MAAHTVPDQGSRMPRMSKSSRAALLAAGVCGATLVALPAMASAATTDVQVGDMNAKLGADMTAYYPSRIVVHKGDSVKFVFRGFHTATFLKNGTKMPPFIAPTGATNPPTNDAAGAPFWWGGSTPELGVNPRLAAPTAATAVTGRTFVNSGLPQGPNASFTVRFPKVGTFVVRCAPHPAMRAVVKVVPPKAHIPSARSVAAQVAREKAADRATARRLARRTAPPDTVLIGPGTRRVWLMGFLPATKSVKAGATLTFRMAGRTENHTVSFGPSSVLDALAASPEPPAQTIFPSDPPPAGPPAVTATAHGDGFVNSGVLADPGTGSPLPKRFTVRFPEAGTYSYICLLHPQMKGAITVTP